MYGMQSTPITRFHRAVAPARRFVRAGWSAAMAVLLLTCAPAGIGAAAEDAGWQPFYEGRFRPAVVQTWLSDHTRSERTPEGLRSVDASREKGRGRLYYAPGRADPETAAEAAARLKCVSCTEAWGVVLSLADGVHEEGVTFYPDRVELAHAGISAPFNTADAFHVYRVRCRGEDVQVWADGRLLIDGKGKFTAPAHAKRSQIAFGSGSSTATGEAVWEYVRFRGPVVPLRANEDVKPPQVPGLSVSVGETRTILTDRKYVGLFRLADGTLTVGDRRSTDGGKTWAPGTAFHTGACQFPDGEVVQLGFSTKRSDRPGYFTVSLSRSLDGGKTAKGEQALLHIPDATGGTGDDGKYYEGPSVDHAIVRLRDGALLAAMYGYFRTDTVLCPGFPPEWKLYKYRTWVMRSTDRGKTWEYLSTVAYDPSVGLESFCEADLLALPNGDILCFLRTGGQPPYSPLYLSRSSDDGKTWSKPAPIADFGVWPNACRMKSGVLACTYGRPGNWLCFSTDEGKAWVGHFRLYDGNTTSYNTVEEVAPDTLLVVEDRQELDEGGNARAIVAGTTVTVRRSRAPGK